MRQRAGQSISTICNNLFYKTIYMRAVDVFTIKVKKNKNLAYYKMFSSCFCKFLLSGILTFSLLILFSSYNNLFDVAHIL